MGKFIKKLCWMLVLVMCMNSFINHCVRNELLSIKHSQEQSDAHAKRSCMRLFSERGGCSGVQVKAPSGKTFIMSAGHCIALADAEGNIMVESEDHRIMKRHVLAASIPHDLMLLEGIPNVQGLDVAPKYSDSRHIRTFTHGRLMETYKTEGDLVQDITVVADNMILEEVATTAKIVPGSSGGMVVDDDGYLVGIASATDFYFGYVVPLRHIHTLIANF